MTSATRAPASRPARAPRRARSSTPRRLARAPPAAILVYRNLGGTSGADQVIGTCTFQGSYQLAAQSASENAVMFENPNDANNPSYRLTSGSPGEVRDRTVTGYTCQNLTDFEGDARPQGTACDCGADEYRAGQ